MADMISLRKRLDKKLQEHSFACQQLEQSELSLERVEVQLRRTEEAQRILQEEARRIQQQAHQRIASVVSRCLATIFPEDPYEFQIQFDKKRGRTEATLVFLRNNRVLDDPLEAAGGGVVDVAAFALRLAKILLARPPMRRLLVMDEPFKHLSRDHAGRVQTLLLDLAQELESQFVMVTHSRELACGKIIKLG